VQWKEARRCVATVLLDSALEREMPSVASRTVNEFLFDADNAGAGAPASTLSRFLHLLPVLPVGASRPGPRQAFLNLALPAPACSRLHELITKLIQSL
jgi:hypothetical protein